MLFYWSIRTKKTEKGQVAEFVQELNGHTLSTPRVALEDISIKELDTFAYAVRTHSKANYLESTGCFKTSHGSNATLHIKSNGIGVRKLEYVPEKHVINMHMYLKNGGNVIAHVDSNIDTIVRKLRAFVRRFNADEM